MTSSKPGKRHPLLIYRRSMNRIWPPALLLGLILAAAWSWIQFSGQQLFQNQVDIWLLVGAVVALSVGLFAFLARSMAYVRAYPTHLRIATPFLRFNLSYRRVRSVYPAGFQQLFPPGDASWSEKSFLEPFYAKTAVVLELNSYPLSPGLLRLFLPPQIFSTRKQALICVIDDWMGFSTEIDSFFGSWQQSAGRQRARSGRWM